MRIYIASRYDRRFEMLGVDRGRFDAGGPLHDVAVDPRPPERARTWCRSLSRTSKDVLPEADCLVSFTEEAD